MRTIPRVLVGSAVALLYAAGPAAPAAAQAPSAGVVNRREGSGVVEVTPRDPATGRPRGAVIALRALQQLELGVTMPPVAPQTITRADASLLDATFAFTLKAGMGMDPDVMKRQLDRAAKDAAAAQAGSSNRLPLGSQEGGPNVSGDAIRSRTGSPLPTS